MLLKNTEDFEIELLVKCHILRVVGFKRKHHFMRVGIADCLLYQSGGNAVVLHLGIDGEVDDVHSVFLVQLVGPAGIQVISAEYEVEKGLQRMVFFDEITVSAEGCQTSLK